MAVKRETGMPSFVLLGAIVDIEKLPWKQGALLGRVEISRVVRW